jgi:hypothetical protein
MDSLREEDTLVGVVANEGVLVTARSGPMSGRR